jgi:hypothetical protein
MSAPDHIVRQGDFGDVIESVLVDSEGVAVSLSGATIRFTMAPITGGVATFTDDADNDQSDTLPSSFGNVSYVWAESDTSTPGLYLAEWEVTFAGGQQQTFPNSGYITVLITEQLTTNVVT